MINEGWLVLGLVLGLVMLGGGLGVFIYGWTVAHGIGLYGDWGPLVWALPSMLVGSVVAPFGLIVTVICVVRAIRR